MGGRKSPLTLLSAMRSYYTYLHATPDDIVFYVGKGSGDRLKTTSNRGTFWKRIAKKYGFIPCLISFNLTEEQAFENESAWIKFYKSIGQCRANFTEGGDGVRVKERWWGDKISKALKGMKRGRGLESKSYKDVVSREQLNHLYVDKKTSSVAIGKMFDVSYSTIIERLRCFGIPIRNPGKKPTTIICTTDGRIFDSIGEAAIYYGVFRENIRKVLCGKYRQTGGKSFEHVPNDK